MWSEPKPLPGFVYPLQGCSSQDELTGTYRIGPSHNIVQLAINYDGYVDGNDEALFTEEYPKQVGKSCGE